MGIKDYFKPDWKNSNEVVREKFIKNLTPSLGIKELIIKILNFEKLAKIRKIALEKINDVATLVQLEEKILAPEVKKEVKNHLEEIISQKYLEHTLTNETYLDYIDSNEKLLSLFMAVNSIHQKKRLIQKIKNPVDLLNILKKTSLKEKELVNYIFSNLEAENLIILLEDREWDNLRDKYSLAIINYLKKNDTKYFQYKEEKVFQKEEKIISQILEKKNKLQLNDRANSKEKAALFQWAEAEFTFLNKKLDLTPRVKQILAEYEKVFFEIKRKEDIRDKTNQSIKYLEEFCLKIKDLEKSDLEKIAAELNSFLSPLENEIKNDIHVIKEIKKINIELEKERKVLAEKEKEIALAKEKRQQQLKELERIAEATGLLIEEINLCIEKENFSGIKAIDEKVKEEEQKYKALEISSEASEPARAVTIKKNFYSIHKSLEKLKNKKQQQEKQKILEEGVHYLESLNIKDLLKENSGLADLKKKISEWEKILENPNVIKSESELINYKKIFLQVKKEIEEKEFRDIQSYLDKKESLLKVLSQSLSLENKFDILEVFYDVKKKWYRIPHNNSFYFRNVNEEFFSLLKAGEEKTKDIKKEFEREQQKKLARKKAMLARIDAILAEVKEREFSYNLINKINKIIEDWKKIYVYSPINLREINLEFKQKINLFFKIKQSFNLEKKKKQSRNYLDKKEYLESVQERIKKFKPSTGRKKIVFLVEERKNWYNKKLDIAREENKKLDEEFFNVIEQELIKEKKPVDVRRENLNKVMEQLSVFSENTTLVMEDFKKAKIAFSSAFKLLQESFLPQGEFQNYYNKFSLLQKEFIKKNSTQLEAEKNELLKNIAKKEYLLGQLINLCETKKLDKKTNLEVKKINQEWQSIPVISRKKENELEKKFRSTINNFYKQLKSKIKTERSFQQENFLSKKKILDRLEYLVNLNQTNTFAEDFIPDENFDVSKLKDIWEYNRQFKHQTNLKGEKRKEIITLLKEWSNHLDLAFSDRKELNLRFQKIKKLLQKNGYMK